MLNFGQHDFSANASKADYSSYGAAPYNPMNNASHGNQGYPPHQQPQLSSHGQPSHGGHSPQPPQSHMQPPYPVNPGVHGQPPPYAQPPHGAPYGGPSNQYGVPPPPGPPQQQYYGGAPPMQAPPRVGENASYYGSGGGPI